MVSSILNRPTACRGVRDPGGMMTASPVFSRSGSPPIRISGLAVQHLHQGVERCGVLCEPLLLVECEEGDVAGVVFQHLFAYDASSAYSILSANRITDAFGNVFPSLFSINQVFHVFFHGRNGPEAEFVGQHFQYVRRQERRERGPDVDVLDAEGSAATAAR